VPTVFRGAIPSPRYRVVPAFRGAISSPRYQLASAVPHVIAGPTPPQLLYNPTKLSFWGRNSVAAEEAFAKACHVPEIFISDEQVEAWAEQHGHGEATVIEVLDWMMNDGFKQDDRAYDDGPHFAVNWTNVSILQNAIAHGPIKLGIAANQLERIFQSHPKDGWCATGFEDDTKYDHCVSLCGYGTFAWMASQLRVQLPEGIAGATPGYGMFTWGTIGIIDHPSMLAITCEAWLRNPTTVPE